MERWHLTLLLAAGAIAGLVLAPSGFPARHSVPERSVPARSVPARSVPAGQLDLSLALDSTAVLTGRGETRNLVVTITAPESTGDRVPVDVALVVDVSGSMGQGGKIEQARAAADALVDALQPGDRFALVAFDDDARVLSEGQAFTDADRLHSVITQLRDDGGTNLYAGTREGLAQLSGTYGASKVVVISDGNANVGITEPSSFTTLAARAVQDGYTLSTIGLGRDFNETLLEGIADAGAGDYHFVGHAYELPSVIAAELARTAETVARRATLHIEVPAGVEIEDVYGWSADISTRGADVAVGDLSAGQSRKVVLRVHIPDDTLGAVQVAAASLTYRSVEGSQRQADATISATVTDDPRAVEASVDTAATVAAARATAGEYTRSSAEAWRRGDDEAAGIQMSRARDVIAEARRSTGVPELDHDASRIDTLEQFGVTEGSEYAAKAAGEASRAFAH